MVYKQEEPSFPRRDSVEKAKGKESKQELVRLHCNKGKAATKFKRSCFGEDGAIASTVFLIACVVCDPSSIQAQSPLPC